HLETESYRHRMLQHAAAGHRRVTIAARQFRERGGNRAEVILDERERFAHLNRGRGVHDVLGGRAPMDILTEFAASMPELIDDRNYRRARDFCSSRKRVEIEVLDFGLRSDSSRCFRWNDSQLSLDACQSCLDIEINRGAIAIVKDFSHRRSAEKVS